MKPLILISLFIFSAVGGYVPALWGVGLFSFSSILGNFIGGLVGLYIGYRLGSYLS